MDQDIASGFDIFQNSAEREYEFVIVEFCIPSQGDFAEPGTHRDTSAVDFEELPGFPGNRKYGHPTAVDRVGSAYQEQHVTVAGVLEKVFVNAFFRGNRSVNVASGPFLQQRLQ